MKFVFCTIELLLYFASLLVIANKILCHPVKWKRVIIATILLYSSFVCICVFGNADAYLSSIFIIQFIQIVITPCLLIPNLKFSTTLGIYLFIYCTITSFEASFQCVIILSDKAWLIAEFLLNLIVFCGVFVCCFYRKTQSFLKQMYDCVPVFYKILILLSFFTSVLLLTLVYAYPDFFQPIPWIITIRITLVFFSFLIFLTFPVLLVTLMTNSFLKERTILFEQDLLAQAKHYSMLAKSNYELRKFRHDFKNIRIGITRSLEENNTALALDIVQKGQFIIDDSTPLFDTGNGIVDAILLDKQEKSAKHHIEISFDGVVSSLLSPIDACIIFGNTLDNAIEACMQLPEEKKKGIHISAQCNSGFLFVRIQNPTAAPVVIRNNMVATTKADKTAHGFGLYSLERTIKKYDGTIKLSYDNYIFTLEMTLPLC